MIVNNKPFTSEELVIKMLADIPLSIDTKTNNGRYKLTKDANVFLDK